MFIDIEFIPYLKATSFKYELFYAHISPWYNKTKKVTTDFLKKHCVVRRRINQTKSAIAHFCIYSSKYNCYFFACIFTNNHLWLGCTVKSVHLQSQKLSFLCPRSETPQLVLTLYPLQLITGEQAKWTQSNVFEELLPWIYLRKRILSFDW